MFKLLTYHFQPLLHRCCALEVLGGRLNVPVNCLLRQVDHVGGEEGLAMLLEVFLIRIHHAIEPRQELLRAVVGVKDDRDTISGSDRSDVVRSCDGTSYRGLLLVIFDALPFISTRVLERSSRMF